MNVKKMIINSLLLAIGAILHQLTPPLILGMKPDFSLAMLFIIMILNDDYKSCVCSGLIAGILAAATTGFPGGQIPNVIDKIVTVNIMFLVLKPFRQRVNNQIKIVFTTAIGTFISGTTFLSVAFVIVGLPTSFKALFLSVVVPGAIINTIAGVILFNAVNIAIKRKAAA
ncbi:tryptophan transporter [Clostridium fermenticellae]|uniref:Tryptophan transporter n=1 Tax=Clostridium fermenticellae TaxID=2068654 RepID=A0A386H2J1_9CLOT|nr:tryptophan transporter [Clostridium fermenticellae]AYD39922.1 tryptophan transporter [Clostridium fermenticellae]